MSSSRPRLHFAPAAGWVNDPHGLTWHDGRYHLFTQHVPDALAWRQDIHWGHATSTDLLTWREQPVALPPGDGDTGCWSGCVVVGDDGEARMLYTAVHEGDLGRGLVRVARPDDASWTTWTKGEVLLEAPTPGTAVFRDPMVVRDGEGWLMLVGHGAEDRTAGAEVFASADLETWEHRGLLASRRPDAPGEWTGDAWECPQLVRLGEGTDVIVVSVWHDHQVTHVTGAVGALADDRYAARAWQQLTFGEGHYATSAFTDREGRPCLVSWIRGIGEPGAWTGCTSLPYVVGVEDDRIRLALHPAVEAARAGQGESGSLDVEWTPDGSGRLELRDAAGRPSAVLTLAEGRLTVAVEGAPGVAPVVVPHDGGGVRLVADGPVLEVVAAGGLVGLPLDADPLTPVADDPGSLAWWRLAPEALAEEVRSPHAGDRPARPVHP